MQAPIDRSTLAWLTGVALFASSTAGAQERALADRVAAAAADASVVMSFAARPGVCGDGRSYISLGRSTISGDGHYDGRELSRGPCERGPVRVVLERTGRAVRDVRTAVGGAPAGARSATIDLGTVDPAAAADYLLTLARQESGRVADRALLPAVLADRAVVWPALLAIVRDSTGSERRASKSSAAFWLSRFAAAARDGHPGDLADRDSSTSEDDEGDVRGRAIFALAQLPRREGIPGLVDVARHHRDPRVRGKALFWLGQSGDARAYALFEELLKGAR